MPFDALSPEFLLTALVVVLAPGTGVIYTLSTAVLQGGRASLAAAFGCTMGIVPHLLASIAGLAALLHASAVAFQVVKLLGVAYLAYLAYMMWRDASPMRLEEGERRRDSLGRIAARGVAINLLNPKLSIFFLAFLPQFVPAEAPDAFARMLLLSAAFMALTFVVFVGYGLAAQAVRDKVLSSVRLTRWMKRTFAAAFAGFAAKLAFTDR